MKQHSLITLILVFSISLNGCVHYSHSAQTNIRQESFDINYEYLKTESLWLSSDYAENANSKTNATNSIAEPTFIELNGYIKRQYGENAVLGNVVWDVKNTIFIWNFQKIESVTFDVYLKK
jgi:hypothetical protein